MLPRLTAALYVYLVLTLFVLVRWEYKRAARREPRIKLPLDLFTR